MASQIFVTFSQQHLDYVFFVYGLGLVLVAAICAVIPRESARGVPWIWLGLFGLVHGFGEWLEILAIDLRDNPAFSAARLAAMALSFVFLCEFARRTLGKLGRKVSGRWTYALLLGLAASGALGGTAGLQATTRYALALVGGLWAAWAMYQADRNDERSRGSLAVAAMGLAGYAVAAGVIVSRASFFPASVLNTEWFNSSVGMPIQLFRGAFGVLIAAALWTYSAHLQRIELSAAESKGVVPLGYGLFIVLAVTLVAGWRFAEFASDWSDDEVREILRVQAATAAAGITSGELAPLSATAADSRDSNHLQLREQLRAVSAANPELRSARLLVLRDGKIFEAVTVDLKDPGRSETGVAHDSPPRELQEAFSPGTVTTLGPYRGKSGDLVSAFAPIRDSPTNTVTGVIGIDIDADDWKQSVAYYRLAAIFTTLLVVLLVIYFFIVRERMWRVAQSALRSESRLATAQRMAHIGSWSLDPGSRRITWSEEMFRIYGRDPKLGPPPDFGQLKALTDPQDWPQVRIAMRKAIEEGADYQLEFRVIRPDGSLRQVEATVHASRANRGNVVALTGTVQDISQRKIAEKALRDSAAQIRLFAENVPAMTVSLDENLRFLFANRRYAEFFGFDPADIVGRHLREIVGDEAYREIEGHFAQALRGYPGTYQRTRKLASGESRYLEVKLFPNVTDQGEILGCFAVTTDITEHHLTEERIQHVAHHDSLTGLPNRLLFNDRLNQSINLAKRSFRQFALLYVDLNRFKLVNDNLGHDAGDELLKGVAERIRHHVRASDTVARIGGDEFAVILTYIARREDAQAVAGKITAALARPFQLGDLKQSVEIGASIGIALYPADAQDADSLVKAADAAMYIAKQAGR